MGAGCNTVVMQRSTKGAAVPWSIEMPAHHYSNMGDVDQVTSIHAKKP
jgi:hypothetical protein